MTQNELRERIKARNLDGVFLFCGEEGYLKRHYIGELRKILVPDEGVAPFVHFVFDGAELDTALLLETARTPSMFGDGKLIEWHNADLEAMKEGEIKALEAFCEEMQNEPGNTVVITVPKEGLDTGTERRPTKLFTRLAKCLNAVPFYRSTDAALVSWIRRHFAAVHVDITESLPAALLAHVGDGKFLQPFENFKVFKYFQIFFVHFLDLKECIIYICITQNHRNEDICRIVCGTGTCVAVEKRTDRQHTSLLDGKDVQRKGRILRTH